MADDKNIESISSRVEQSSLTLIIAVIAVVIVIGAAVFFTLQKSSVKGQNERLDAEISSLREEIQLLEGQKVEAARTAQQFLASIEEEEIRWSRVISRINSLIPYDGAAQQPKVEFLSYNGSANGKINLNAQTRTTKGDPLADVSETISAFTDTSFFSNAIVPSVTLGENDQGDKTASFILNLDYTESAPEEIDLTGVMTDEDTEDVGAEAGGEETATSGVSR